MPRIAFWNRKYKKINNDFGFAENILFFFFLSIDLDFYSSFLPLSVQWEVNSKMQFKSRLFSAQTAFTSCPILLFNTHTHELKRFYEWRRNDSIDNNNLQSQTFADTEFHFSVRFLHRSPNVYFRFHNFTTLTISFLFSVFIYFWSRIYIFFFSLAKRFP